MKKPLPFDPFALAQAAGEAAIGLAARPAELLAVQLDAARQWSDFWSGTLGVSDYRYFNLRDNISGGTGLFDSIGLLRDDYSRKPAFATFRRAVRSFGLPRGPVESGR